SLRPREAKAPGVFLSQKYNPKNPENLINPGSDDYSSSVWQLPQPKPVLVFISNGGKLSREAILGLTVPFMNFIKFVSALAHPSFDFGNFQICGFGILYVSSFAPLP